MKTHLSTYPLFQPGISDVAAKVASIIVMACEADENNLFFLSSDVISITEASFAAASLYSAFKQWISGEMSPDIAFLVVVDTVSG